MSVHDIEELERNAYRIVGMICSESVPEPEIASAIDELRTRTSDVFGADSRVFERIYARRFARLRTRFRPAPGLFTATV